MKRYYLSKIKRVFIPAMGDFVYRHRVQEIPNVEYVGGDIASDPTTGLPLHPALLVLLAAKDHAQFVNDPEMAEMPMVPVDVRVNAISASAKSRAQTGAQTLGWTSQQVGAVWTAADDFRDIVNHYGRLNNPAFDADRFDVNES